MAWWIEIHINDRVLCATHFVHTYDEAAEFSNILRSAEKCCNGGRWKPSVQRFEVNMLIHCAQLSKDMKERKHKPKPTNDFWLSERGKLRRIRAHHIKDRTVYKSFCRNVLIPNTEGLIIDTNSASQEGKGTDFAIKRFRKDLAHAYKVCKGREFYVFTFDFHDYFGSIPHPGIAKQLRKRLDDDSMEAMRLYTELFDDGIGIGGEPSQVVAILYPQKLDWKIRCHPNVIAYGRYMDDGYIIARTKEELKEVIELFYKLVEELGLIINPKHTEIYNMAHDTVVFLKKRTFITETGKIVSKLVRKNVTDEMKRLRYQKKQLDNGDMPMEHIEQSMGAWLSYALKYHSYHSIRMVVIEYSRLFGVSRKEVWNLAKGHPKRNGTSQGQDK